MPLQKLLYLYISLDLERGGSKRSGLSVRQLISVLYSNTKVWLIPSSLQDGTEQQSGWGGGSLKVSSHPHLATLSLLLHKHFWVSHTTPRICLIHKVCCTALLDKQICPSNLTGLSTAQQVQLHYEFNCYNFHVYNFIFPNKDFLVCVLQSACKAVESVLWDRFCFPQNLGEGSG